MLLSNVTRFGKCFNRLWQFVAGLFSIWLNFEATFDNVLFYSQISKSNPVNWPNCFCMTRLEVKGRLVFTGWEFSLRSYQGNHFQILYHQFTNTSLCKDRLFTFNLSVSDLLGPERWKIQSAHFITLFYPFQNKHQIHW